MISTTVGSTSTSQPSEWSRRAMSPVYCQK